MPTIELLGTPQAPDEVVTRLHQIDPHLNLKFVQFPTGEDGNAVRWWALVWEWPKEDQRYTMIMRNEMRPDAAFDVLGYLPLDCDVYSAFDYVKNHLIAKRNHPELGKLADRVGEFNRQRKTEIKAEVMAQAEQVIEANIAPIMEGFNKRQPKVFQKGK